MTDATIIVTGLGRCGTSLIMQMLAAGGLPVVGTYPDFESEAAERERGAEPSRWLLRTAGRGVKVLDPHRVPPPASGAYRAIWLTRDLDQQAASQIKLIGAAPSRSMRRGMAQSLRRDEPRARRAVEAVAEAVLHLRFEQVIAEPRRAAERIIAHVGVDRFAPMAVTRMAGAVVHRGPECLPGMLEHYLLAGAA